MYNALLYSTNSPMNVNVTDRPNRTLYFIFIVKKDFSFIVIILQTLLVVDISLFTNTLLNQYNRIKLLCFSNISGPMYYKQNNFIIYYSYELCIWSTAEEFLT